MNRDVGDLGEKKLTEWCAQVGIVATKPDRDRNGWDFLLEFPKREANDLYPPDRVPPPLHCWVQVKSSDGKRNGRVKLSNWKSLIDRDQPAFFLVIEYDGLPTPQRPLCLVCYVRWDNC